MNNYFASFGISQLNYFIDQNRIIRGTQISNDFKSPWAMPRPGTPFILRMPYSKNIRTKTNEVVPGLRKFNGINPVSFSRTVDALYITSRHAFEYYNQKYPRSKVPVYFVNFQEEGNSALKVHSIKDLYSIINSEDIATLDFSAGREEFENSHLFQLSDYER